MTLLEKLQQLLSEGATAEQILSSLGEFMIPKGTFNEVNNKAKAIELENAQLKATLQGKDQELETIKTANMTEHEKLLFELEKAQNEIKTSKVQANRSLQESKFALAGFTPEQYNAILDRVVSDDLDATSSIIDAMLGLTSSKVENAKQEQLNELLKNNTPPAGSTKDTTPTGITKDSFRNMTAVQKQELYNTDRETYDAVSKP